MYAFRKPYAAATYEGSPELFGLSHKAALVIAQTIGYALSKFIGIKFVSEAKSDRRATTILSLIAVAEIALLLFAVTPPKYRFLLLFLNGIPLGMIWGLVFSYLEGRRTTEIMGLMLCGSFIFSSGFVKSRGQDLLAYGITEPWMPVLTGLMFAIPLAIAVWLLNHLPPPNVTDQSLRTERVPMFGHERLQTYFKFATGLTALVFVYSLITAYRDFRDNFMADIFNEIYGSAIEVSYERIESWVAVSVLVALMFLVRIKNSFYALIVNHIVVTIGILLTGGSTWAYSRGWISDQWWMGLTGFGCYVAYIPFNCILFERLIAAFKQPSNAGFFIYVADAVGYVGAVGVLFYKSYGAKDLSWVSFFSNISYALTIMGGAGMIGSLVYFARKHSQNVVENQEKGVPRNAG